MPFENKFEMGVGLKTDLHEHWVISFDKYWYSAYGEENKQEQ